MEGQWHTWRVQSVQKLSCLTLRGCQFLLDAISFLGGTLTTSASKQVSPISDSWHRQEIWVSYLSGSFYCGPLTVTSDSPTRVPQWLPIDFMIRPHLAWWVPCLFLSPDFSPSSKVWALSSYTQVPVRQTYALDYLTSMSLISPLLMPPPLIAPTLLASWFLSFSAQVVGFLRTWALFPALSSWLPCSWCGCTYGSVFPWVVIIS